MGSSPVLLGFTKTRRSARDFPCGMPEGLPKPAKRLLDGSEKRGIDFGWMGALAHCP
ncbi:hypothetical protein MPNT_50077 [Candidatus Methylacidithermus pantelleriae]|uniref:Uncharacterized protein n=1 Tax=Candidatus Methylacidithermus pantelleriae TaxID=2744239 RepID=A0A8J2BUV0_9BACT|nr:hypothetical protein MPNT_50077 [Candidatus Methylacidithermus pantelleriae]